MDEGKIVHEAWDEDIIQQYAAIQAAESQKIPYVGDKILDEQYAAIRRNRGDGNCFFRGFMFAYLEHLLISQDKSEVDRIKTSVEKCRGTLQSLGYVEFTFEDFFALFLEQLDDVIQGSDSSISNAELVQRCRDQSVSDYGDF